MPLSFIGRVNIYEITVNPCKGDAWAGLFNFKPNAEDVAAAMRRDISELDGEIEHEYDDIQSLRQTLELVTLQAPELLGQVKIAGTYIGEISIAIVKVYAKKQVAAKPEKPCGEVPLSSEVQSELWRDKKPKTDLSELVQERADAGQKQVVAKPSNPLGEVQAQAWCDAHRKPIDLPELVQQRADAGQFDVPHDEYSAAALDEALKDPRTGQPFQLQPWQTAVDGSGCSLFRGGVK